MRLSKVGKKKTKNNMILIHKTQRTEFPLLDFSLFFYVVLSVMFCVDSSPIAKRLNHLRRRGVDKLTCIH